MGEKLERKTFLKRLGVGIASAFSLPVLGKQLENKMENSAEKDIFDIKPMGFQWETQDPFLFCVHHEDKFPKGNDLMGPAISLTGRQLGDDFIIKDGFRMYHGRQVPGFPGHPHRGFETVTVVREGFVDHADSLGAAGRYGQGDVQWMTAGKGVQHSEMFPLLSKDKGNPMELFQIWLNLPKKNKMVEPHFKMLWAESIPKVVLKDKSGKQVTAEVMAGTFMNKKAPEPPPDSWAANPEHDVAILNFHVEPGAHFVLPKAKMGINRSAYFYVGESISVNGQIVKAYHSFSVKPEVSLSIQNSHQESRILILQGKPIGEPVMQYGPFVMNTKEEIHQAFDDYHKTQFGGWPWPKTAQVHDRNAGRFALHANGKKEVKG